jgi:hypothetical protein
MDFPPLRAHGNLLVGVVSQTSSCVTSNENVRTVSDRSMMLPPLSQTATCTVGTSTTQHVRTKLTALPIDVRPRAAGPSTHTDAEVSNYVIHDIYPWRAPVNPR